MKNLTILQINDTIKLHDESSSDLDCNINPSRPAHFGKLNKNKS